MKKLFLGVLLLFLVMPIFGQKSIFDYPEDEIVNEFVSFVLSLEGGEGRIQEVQSYIEKNRGDKIENRTLVLLSYEG